MAPGMSLFSVNAILILSTEDGSRLFSKYYTAPHHGPSATQKDGMRSQLPMPAPSS